MSELISFDNELFALANYEASEGLIPVFKTQEEIAKYRVKVAKIFNRYKISIQRGECDIDFILNTVMTKYGAIPRPNMTPEEIVDNLLAGNDMSQVKEEPLLGDTLMDIFKRVKSKAQEIEDNSHDHTDLEEEDLGE